MLPDINSSNNNLGPTNAGIKRLAHNFFCHNTIIYYLQTYVDLL